VQPIIFAAQEQIMRKLFVLILAFVATLPAFSQETSPKKKFDLGNRPGDHFMVQLALNSWQGAPDSISSHISGFQRSANVYVMLDKPFKANPKFSIGVGVGVGTSNIYFKKMNVEIGASVPVLPFIATDTLSNYKKYKLTTAFVELPVELRFSGNPVTPNKSVKVAIGMKLGTLVNAHTKGKILRDKAGNTLNNYTVKTSSKSYFNSTRLAATARVGYGAFSLFGAYTLTGMFKDGVASDAKLLQVGLNISGL
jgi:hypothetical protein